MYGFRICLALGLVMAVGSACSLEPASVRTRTDPAFGDIPKNSFAAEQQLKDKKTYEEDTEYRLKNLDSKIEELKGQGKELNREARKELEELSTELQKKRDQAAIRFQELRAAGAATWKRLKEGVDQAIDEAEEFYEWTKSKLQDSNSR
ncbi:MAG: hypothetical protein HY645_14095 [Acidobacteria bacterium]|nr:hypothetical protein [Acidobacteriota bacterium]